MQWNMRGLQANSEELSSLLSQYHPKAVCIRETLLCSNKTACFKNYSYYDIPAVENNSSLHAGVAILIKNSTPHQQLHINTGLDDIAVRATCHKTITMCSIYFPLYSMQYHWAREPHSSASSSCFASGEFQYTQSAMGLHQTQHSRKDGRGLSPQI